MKNGKEVRRARRVRDHGASQLRSQPGNREEVLRGSKGVGGSPLN